MQSVLWVGKLTADTLNNNKEIQTHERFQITLFIRTKHNFTAQGMKTGITLCFVLINSVISTFFLFFF